MSKFEAMKRGVPALRTLDAQAREAGRAKKGWWETWIALAEPLSKCVGHGSGGRFTTAKDYEVARRGLLFAWLAPDGAPNIPPWELNECEGETEVFGPALLAS